MRHPPLVALLVALPVTFVAAGAEAQSPENWTVSPDPLLDVGGMGVSQGVLFTRMVGAAALPDGRYVVADGGEQHLVLVAADGSARTVGRQGEGPGEFTSLRGVWATPEGGFATWDSRQRRFTRFDADGGVVDTNPAVVPADDARFTGANLDGFAGALRDGRPVLAWIAAAGFGQGGPPRETPLPDRMIFGVFGTDGRLEAVLGDDTGMIRWYHEGGGGPLPFSPWAWTGVVGDTLVSTNGTGEARFFAPEAGGPQRTLELPGEAPDRRAAWAALETLAAAGDIPDLWASRLPLLDPEAGPIPLHGRMLADDGGHLWLKAYDPAADALPVRGGGFATGGLWTVVDTDGTPMAVVVMPDDLAPLAVVGDHVLAVARDAFDVERFVVVRLTR